MANSHWRRRHRFEGDPESKVLIVTNRALDATYSDERLLSNRFVPFASTLSACEVRKSTSRKARWKTSDPLADAKDEELLSRFKPYFCGARPILIYLHGNNNSPSDCFGRCFELESSYRACVIGFSWTSEGLNPDGSDLPDVSGFEEVGASGDGNLEDISRVALSNGEGWAQRKARRYQQAKCNAQSSASALARFLRLVASARLADLVQPFSVAAHSLGCHFLHYTVGANGTAESLAVASNVALIAGCTGAAKHSSWVGRINPVGKVYIAYTGNDSVLAAATLIDHDVKLGANPGDQRLVGAKYRYVDFEGSARIRLGAHQYFVSDEGRKLSKASTKLFSRVFCSLPDVLQGESIREVYPMGCATDGSTCFMGSTGGSGDGGNWG